MSYLLKDEVGDNIVRALGQMEIIGNIIPPSWLVNLKTPKGRPNLIAAYILAEIVYWYRPTDERAENTGLYDPRKKFKADLLQLSSGQIANRIGVPRRTVQTALQYLKKAGLIEIVLRTVQTKSGMKLSNVPYIILDIDVLHGITFPSTQAHIDTENEEFTAEEDEVDTESRHELSRNSREGIPEFARPSNEISETYTNITTHNSTKTTTKVINPPTPPTKESSSSKKVSKATLSHQQLMDLLEAFPKLQTDKFKETWGRWIEYRRQSRKPLTQMGADSQLEKLSKLEITDAIARTEKAIIKGWQGIVFPEDEYPKNTTITPIPGQSVSPQIQKDGSLYV